jgi:flagellar protein FlaJ
MSSPDEDIHIETVSELNSSKKGEGATVEQINKRGFIERLYLSLSELFYPVYHRIFSNSANRVQGIQNDLAKANLNISVEIYLSAALGFGAIFGSLLGVLTMGTAWMLAGDTLMLGMISPASIPLENSVVSQAIITVGGVIFTLFTFILALISSIGVGMGTGTITAIVYPKHRAKRRGRKIDLMLPDFVSFLYALSLGGLDHQEIIEAGAGAKDTYGEVGVEFARIVRDFRFFNTDYQTAIRQISEETPSEELAELLTDMLSVINSGGDITQFMESKKNEQMESIERRQEETINKLSLASEGYMTLSIAPIVGLIILIIMSLIQNPQPTVMLVLVYGGIPMINIMFIIVISSLLPDDAGSAYLDPDGVRGSITNPENSLFSTHIIDKYKQQNTLFSSFRAEEYKHRLGNILDDPFAFLIQNPLYVAVITIPISIISLATLTVGGIAKPSWEGLLSAPVMQTIYIVYMPLFINIVPLAILYEYKSWKTSGIMSELTEQLRSLANANETGQPLLECFNICGNAQGKPLEEEFDKIYTKTKLGTPFAAALIEFNNKYEVPRLARTTKLIQQAQEASSHITEVLRTAGETSRYEDRIKERQKSSTAQVTAIIAIIFLIFLGVMIMMQAFFVDKMVEFVGEGAALSDKFQSINPSFLALLYVHASVIQGGFGGLTAGYIRERNLFAGLKYVIFFLLIGIVAWAAVLVFNVV